MKRTLLDMVQSIMTSMGSDEVNSLDDSPESLIVAEIIRQTFYDIIAEQDWQTKRTLRAFPSTGTLDRPTHLKIPTNVQKVQRVSYDKAREDDLRVLQQPVTYLFPEQFLEHTNNRNSEKDNVVTVTDFSGVPLLVQDNHPPTYWTSFDDKFIVFDSYDSAVENTVHGSKTQCLVLEEKGFEMSDEFIPDISSKLFPILFNEAKSRCFFEIKNSANIKAEQQARRLYRKMSRQNSRAHPDQRYPNYGRNPGKGRNWKFSK